jgi:two-component system, NarL family, nitrate/nitrite response regulator NarL
MHASKPSPQHRSAYDGSWVPSVLLVDDHPMFRAGLLSILTVDGARWRAFESASVGPALDAIAEGQHFDLVVYDWHLHSDGGGGVRGLLAIRQMAPNVPIVVLTADTDEAVAVAARALGAAAFLPKSAEGHQLRNALIGLLDPLGATRPAAAPETALRAQPPVHLTLRQLEVLKLMAQGLPNKRIALLLGIADATVRAHVTDILETLQASNRTEAVIKASRCGVIDAAGGPGALETLN